jgi:hypothetical protein
VRGARVDFEFAAAQLSPEMLAQRLLVDLELIGDFIEVKIRFPAAGFPLRYCEGTSRGGRWLV